MIACRFAQALPFVALCVIFIHPATSNSICCGNATNVYLVGPVAGFCALSILSCFPGLILALHSRPVYFEDLQTVRASWRSETRERFQNIFTVVLSCSSAIFLGLVLDYVMFRATKSITNIELVGVVGGLVTLFSKFQMYVGRGLLWFVHRWKERSEESALTSSPEMTASPATAAPYIN